MRERINKKTDGRNNPERKEVRVSINKSGLNAAGEQRYVLAIRFADESYKKVSDNGYIVIEIDKDLNRLYFLPAGPDEGFKLTGTKAQKARSISFTIYNCDDWTKMEGCYFLLKDPKEGIYYIDYSEE